jgi:hypothetical protein
MVSAYRIRRRVPAELIAAHSAADPASPSEGRCRRLLSASNLIMAHGQVAFDQGLLVIRVEDCLIDVLAREAFNRCAVLRVLPGRKLWRSHCSGSCPVQAGKLKRLVAPVGVKVVHPGIHLVLKNAIGSSARCPADDKHAAAANIDPDRISLIGGGFTDRPTCWTAGPPLALSAHRSHLR